MVSFHTSDMDLARQGGKVAAHAEETQSRSRSSLGKARSPALDRPSAVSLMGMSSGMSSADRGSNYVVEKSSSALGQVVPTLPDH